MNSFTCTICGKNLEASSENELSILIHSHYRRSHKLSGNVLKNIIPYEHYINVLNDHKFRRNLAKALKTSVSEYNNILLAELGNEEYDQLITCEICGIKANSLYAHITRTHKMKINEYSKKYNSPVRSDINLKKATEAVLGKKNAMYNNGDPKNSPFSKEFYLNKKLDNDSAELASKTFQTKVSNNRSYTTNIEYYEDKFKVNRQTALQMRRTRQTTNSTETIAKRNNISIDSAQTIRNEITNRWISTLKSKSIEELADINRRKQAGSISKSSIKFFDEVVKCSGINKNECQYGDSGEFSIISQLTTNYGLPKMYLYDFKFRNKIIEFNGDLYHANPNKYSELDTPFIKIRGVKNKHITAKEIWEYDNIKNKTLIMAGYELLVIWEYDVKNDIKNCINKCIDFLVGGKQCI